MPDPSSPHGDGAGIERAPVKTAKPNGVNPLKTNVSAKSPDFAPPMISKTCPTRAKPLVSFGETIRLHWLSAEERPVGRPGPAESREWRRKPLESLETDSGVAARSACIGLRAVQPQNRTASPIGAAA